MDESLCLQQQAHDFILRDTHNYHTSICQLLDGKFKFKASYLKKSMYSQASSLLFSKSGHPKIKLKQHVLFTQSSANDRNHDAAFALDY